MSQKRTLSLEASRRWLKLTVELRITNDGWSRDPLWERVLLGALAESMSGFGTRKPSRRESSELRLRASEQEWDLEMKNRDGASAEAEESGDLFSSPRYIQHKHADGAKMISN